MEAFGPRYEPTRQRFGRELHHRPLRVQSAEEVPPTMATATAYQAVAWTFGKNESDYAPEFESVSSGDRQLDGENPAAAPLEVKDNAAKAGRIMIGQVMGTSAGKIETDSTAVNGGGYETRPTDISANWIIRVRSRPDDFR